jgi:protein TonB
VRVVIALALLAGLVFGQSASTMPAPIYQPAPKYTDEALKAKIEGPVFVQVLIDEKGIPRDPTVAYSLDNGLDKEAIKAVKLWRFKPGLRDGKPVSVSVILKIVFRLRQ